MTLGVVAGTQVFLVHEGLQTSSTQDDIISLINTRHIQVIDRIADDAKDKILAFKDQEKACEVLEATISNSKYHYDYCK